MPVVLQSLDTSTAMCMDLLLSRCWTTEEFTGRLKKVFIHFSNHLIHSVFLANTKLSRNFNTTGINKISRDFNFSHCPWISLQNFPRISPTMIVDDSCISPSPSPRTLLFRTKQLHWRRLPSARISSKLINMTFCLHMELRAFYRNEKAVTTWLIRNHENLVSQEKAASLKSAKPPTFHTSFNFNLSSISTFFLCSRRDMALWIWDLNKLNVLADPRLIHSNRGVGSMIAARGRCTSDMGVRGTLWGQHIHSLPPFCAVAGIGFRWDIPSFRTWVPLPPPNCSKWMFAGNPSQFAHFY